MPRHAISWPRWLSRRSNASPLRKAKLAELSGPDFATAVQMATREVCFRYQPQTLEDVARRVVDLMQLRGSPVLGGAR
jgi:hypothetical protein